MAEDLETGIKKGKAYDMASLLLRFQESLDKRGTTSESYTKQHLNSRLEKHFGDKIVFCQPSNRSKPEIVYSSAIKVQDVLNAWADNTPAPEGKSKDQETVTAEDIFRVANYIKKEIKGCKGISTRPFDARDMSVDQMKKLIPGCLYWLIRLLITSEGKDYPSLDESSTCKSLAAERQVISIAQDIIHCSSNSRTKLPKHIGLALCVHHLTSSRLVITLLNKMGHCCSYDELRAADTSIAAEVLAKADEYGTVVPSNIAPGPFLQLAADNTDINEETLDGKNTTRATSMVVFQRRPYGPEPPPVQLANHNDRKRSLPAGGRIYERQECSAIGRQPQVIFYTGQVKQEWFKEDNELFEAARCADEVWKVMRMHPSDVTESQSPEVITSQSVPGWSAFNAMLYPELPEISMVGYCPLIDGSSTEFSTIYTVLKHAQAISNTMGQEDTVITFDLAIYVKAKQIQWRSANEFSNVVIRMGTFHIALNFLAIIGKKYLNSGLQDLLIESGVYAAGTTSVLMKGKLYNRGVRAHKLCMEAFFRLMWL